MAATTMMIEFAAGYGEYQREITEMAFIAVEMALNRAPNDVVAFHTTLKRDFDEMYEQADHFVQTGTIPAMPHTAASKLLRYRFAGSVDRIARSFAGTKYMDIVVPRMPRAMISAFIELDRDDLLSRYVCFGERDYILAEIAENNSPIRCYRFVSQFASADEMSEIAAVFGRESSRVVRTRARGIRV